jgi:hypothetical protein
MFKLLLSAAILLLALPLLGQAEDKPPEDSIQVEVRGN